MSEEMERLAKIERQIELPKKPKPGTLSGWVLCLFVWCVVGIVYYLGVQKAEIVRVPVVILLVVMIVIGIVSVMSIFVGYFNSMKDYQLSQKNEQEYRKKKALEFITKDIKNKELDELFVEYKKTHPSKKLPASIDEAILMQDSLALQNYLEFVEEEKGRRAGVEE